LLHFAVAAVAAANGAGIEKSRVINERERKSEENEYLDEFLTVSGWRRSTPLRFPAS
jgi:hypothetical protein